MRDDRRRSLRVMARLASAGLLVVALSCSGDSNELTGPSNPPPANPPLDDQSAVVATEPVVPAGGSASLVTLDRGLAGLASLSDGEVSYVSFAPGSQPEADSAEVINRTRDLVVGAPMVNGGLDPISVPASVGDTLVITTYRQAIILESVEREIPERNSPVIVRTDPPRGKTRLPLNSRILIVFSEPIAIGSATTDNLHLLRDGQPVSADITLDAGRLRVELRPDVPLSPQTDYTLLIDTGVTDLSGDPLEQGAEITFSTTEATLSVIPGDASIAVGVRLQLMARLTNPSGGSETLPPVIWSSSDPSVVEVSGAGVLTGVGAGSANISATIEGLEALATITIVGASHTTFAELTAGRDHTCGLTAEGLAYCWGSNEYGQLGDGAGGPGVRQVHPVPVIGGHSFSMLAAGSHHTCGQATSGTILCWGRNNRGQLGDGLQADHDVPKLIAGSDVYVALTAGLDHTCARSAAAVDCWGRNIGNVLGNWTISSTPRQVSTAGGLTWAPIDYDARRRQTGSNWGPVIIYGGAILFWWGQPPEGRLALDLATLSIPATAGALPRILNIDIDSYNRCAVTLGGGAHCLSRHYDDDFMHEHGLGIEVCAGTDCTVRGFDVSYWYSSGRNPWEDRPLIEGARQVVNGSFHTCALTLDGAAYCWGAADRGQLGRAADPFGDGRFLEEVDTPDPVEGNLSFATLAAGQDHTCAVTWSGETYCWGANGFGQLGDGTRTDRYAPVRVDFSE